MGRKKDKYTLHLAPFTYLSVQSLHRDCESWNILSLKRQRIQMYNSRQAGPSIQQCCVFALTKHGYAGSRLVRLVETTTHGRITLCPVSCPDETRVDYLAPRTFGFSFPFAFLASFFFDLSSSACFTGREYSKACSSASWPSECTCARPQSLPFVSWQDCYC